MSTQHLKYVKDVSTHLTRWLRRKSRPLLPDLHKAALTLMHLDLQPAREILSPLYCPSARGRKPFDPITMLRALLLMTLMKVESLTHWAIALKHSSRLARIAGFDPHHTPAVGTFYLFIDRLEDGPYFRPCEHRHKKSDLRHGKHRRNLASEKQQRQLDKERALDQYDSLTAKLCEELLANHSTPRQGDLSTRLSDLLIRCGVIPSAEKGFIDAGEPLTICGDGSALPTGASGNGTPTCECGKEGIYDCDCVRYYSDKTATWGYDSYRECYYFGHTFYQHVISTGGHDLPIHISIGPAHETDFTLSLKDLDHLGKTLRENQLDWEIAHGVYDGGHDGRGVYDYLNAVGIKPAIALNIRRRTHPNPTGTAILVSDTGVPICPAGLEMRRHSHDPKRHRTYYNCPVKRPTHRDGKYTIVTHEAECPLGSLCQPETKMGPVVYVKTDTHPRLYPPISRTSAKYKELQNLRSGCERSNGQKKITYKLGQRVSRNDVHYLVRLHLVSLIEHANVWASATVEKIGTDPVALEQWVIKQLDSA